MTAPREDPPIDEFVDKFRNAIKDTPLEDRRTKNNKSHQKFETQLRGKQGEYTVYSHLKTQSAWGEGEGLRGPHSHIGIIDEFQDVDEGSFSVFLEVIDQSIPEVDYFPSLFIIGTPKLKNTFFHDLWRDSNQRTWSQDDREWTDKGSVGEYAPPNAEDLDIEAFTVKGWHVDQPNSPLHDEGAIQYKRESYSEKKYKNEVLAQFYSPEDDLLTERDVRAAFDEKLGFRNTRRYDDSYVVVAVDWGGGQGEDASDTVIGVAERLDLGEDEDDPYELTLRDINFIDHDVSQAREVQIVRDYIANFDPELVLVDEGYGASRREELQEDYFETVKGVGFGNVTPKDDVKWRTNDRDRKVFVTVDKSYTSEFTTDAVKDGFVTIPSKDLSFGTDNADGSKLVKQLTATYKEFDETPSGTKKLKVQSDRNDDAFDVFCYLVLGAVKLYGMGPTLTTVALNDRF